MEQAHVIDLNNGNEDVYTKLSSTVGTSEVIEPYGQVIGGEGHFWVEDIPSTYAVTDFETPIELQLTIEELRIIKELSTISGFITKLKKNSEPEHPDIRNSAATNIYDLIEND